MPEFGKTRNLVLALLGVLFIGLSVWSYVQETYRILFISWISFVSLSLPLVFGNLFSDNPVVLVWTYGVSSGAMVLSAVIFMLPQVSGQLGMIGLGAGIVLGYGIHTISHNTSHKFEEILSGRREIVSLTLHTIFAGTAIGLVYSQSPEISVILGVAIVSHKFPAGFSVIRKLDSEKLILYPSILFGVFCLGSFVAVPILPSNLSSLIFGLGAGVFIHMAMDFLPECERGDIYAVVDESEEEHRILDRLRYHALGSVIFGSLVVVLLWAIVI